MPESQPSDVRSERGPDERAADHAAIDRLAAELLPSLVAKLGATGLGELEVREGSWRVRLRRPAEPSGGPGGPAAGASSGRSRRNPDADRPERAGERPLRSAHHPLETVTARTESRGVATSPAVGIYRPRTDLTVGDRVRAGDRLGAVDMLGVAQEVVAPIDGIVGASLVESGDAVEYGQELLAIELVPSAGVSTNGTS
ncbi:MAG TPA: biotin/lipoyl-containing protein [Candidatus Saccharimonadales bacterium]|nr:biotin/lipoyl-containing protein [Candidatus Saccharimonadales bacterium]